MTCVHTCGSILGTLKQDKRPDFLTLVVSSSRGRILQKSLIETNAAATEGSSPSPGPNTTQEPGGTHLGFSWPQHSPPPHYPSLTTGKPQKHRIFSHHTLQITPSRAPSCPVSPCERGQTGSCDRPPRRGRRSHKWVTAGGQGKWNAGPSSLHLPSCLFYLRFPLPGHKTVNVLPASPLPLFCFTIFLLLGQEPHRNRISTTNEMLLKRFSLHYSVLIYIF